MSRIFIVASLAVATTAGLVGTGVLSYDFASLTSTGETSVEPASPAAPARTAADAAATRTAALTDTRTDARPAERTGKAADPNKPGFDIIRLDPDSFSVFAGKAMPNATVTVLANGRPIASAKASGTGDWSIVVEHPFAAGEHKLTVIAKPGDQAPAVEGQTVSMVVAKGATRMAEAQQPAAAARKEASAAATKSAPTTTSTKAVAELERMVVSARSGSPEQPMSLPVPITFLYDEAVFTAEGQKAAALLAEYLQLRRLNDVVLSGHADERGSDRYNMELSWQRLESVARYLRENGYKGRLTLLPKGKSEPYMGIDRNALPKEQVFQLDRRVELHLTR
ncbi:MAG TPA: OmpA family protein [Hyphomicrobiaceae bacterium]|nr:OmpA family protein [Hyphomicrobiaceae bacterium]